MAKINRYLFSNFITTLASLFSTLFIIMSIVFFIQIARITAIIEINFLELIKLYLFMLPRILIFTLPIAFFVALAMMFFRLSKENESIVMFTLGYSPQGFASFFLIIASFLSAMLLSISIVMIPIAENLNDNFVEYKKTKATLNIKASEFGQKFGEWMVYIQSDKVEANSTVYENIIMYYPKKDDDNEKIIIAKEGKFRPVNSSFELVLKNGKAYTIMDKNWHITEFEAMTIRTVVDNSMKSFTSIKDYWLDMANNDKRKKDFSIYILVSLFPLATTLFALSFGIITYRYEKGSVYVGIFTVLFLYFAGIMVFAKYPQIAIVSIFSICFMLSAIFFRRKILSRY